MKLANNKTPNFFFFVCSDLEFLNMFPENLEALYELQTAVQEFTDSYVYIKGYNKCTVERIQHMYMKTYRVIYIHIRIYVTVLTLIFVDYITKK